MTSFLTYLRAPWRVRTVGELTFLLLGLPMGVAWSVYAMTMYSLSLGLLILWVGFAVFAIAHVSMRWIGAVERGQVNALLGESIQAPRPLRDSVPRELPGDAGKLQRIVLWARALAHDGYAWRVVVWVLARMVLGPIGFAIALVTVVVPLSLLVAFAAAVAIDAGWLTITWSTANTGVPQPSSDWYQSGYLGLPLFFLLTPMFTLAVRGFAYIHRGFASWALGPGPVAVAAAATERAELAEEQVRIDQELHDSIGHMITMNIVQAGAAAHVFDSDPEFARQALTNIEERGRAAMGELDRIIAAIRGDAAPRTPLPGIGEIPALVEASRAAGMEIDAVLDAPPVPSAVGRAVFGVVREALTNAAKHAPGAPVVVTVARDGDAVGIAVVNAAAAKRPDAVQTHREGVRHGLAGIRDRVALLGGRSAFGPEAGGFAVRALLPLEAVLASKGPQHSPWASLRERVSA